MTSEAHFRGSIATAQSVKNWRDLAALMCDPNTYSSNVIANLNTNLPVADKFNSANEAYQYYCVSLFNNVNVQKDSYCCGAAGDGTRAGALRALVNAEFSCCLQTLQIVPASGASIDRLSTFSSRGPTLDGRIKPDVLAPGERLVSAFADANDNTQQCASDPNSRLYAVQPLQGTSMATPALAGSAALVREYFLRGFGACGKAAAASSPSFVSSSLVKATIINSAVYAPITDAAGSTFAAARKPYQVGFGRVKLDTALRFEGDALALQYW